MGHQPFKQLFVGAFGHLDCRFGRLVEEAGDHQRYEASGGKRSSADVKRAFGSLSAEFEFPSRHLEDRLDAFGMSRKDLSGIGQDGAMSSAVHEMHAGNVFQPADADRECRLRNAKSIRGLLEGAGAIDREKIAKQSRVEIHVIRLVG